MKKNPSPNFLTCPAFPELPPKKEDGFRMHPSATQKAIDLEEQIGEERHGSKNEESPKKRRSWMRWAMVGTLLVVVILVTPAAIAVSRAIASATTAKAAIQNAQTKIKNMDVEGARRDLEVARTSLSDMHDRFQETGFWRDFPGVGLQLRALEDASMAGAETLDGAENLLNVYQVVADALRGGISASGGFTTGVASTRSFNDLTAAEKRDLLQRFSNVLPDARIARDKIDLALELWNRVPQSGVFSPIRSALKPLADTLPLLKQTLDQAVPLMEAAVPLAGYPTPTRYLVVLQNSGELRPAGGFIGTVGTMMLDAGDLVEFSFNDIYHIDGPVEATWKEVPPVPIAERLGVRAWYLRDANWSPDFPTSADRMLDFYAREIAQGTGKPLPNPPNTVLALEPGLFTSLLRLTGPITVAGQTYTADTFFDTLEYQVELGFLKQGIPVAQRKALIQQIGTQIVDKVKALPSSRWPEIVNLLTTALQRKQIMLYSRDVSLLGLLDAHGWTARTKPTVDDYVQIVDANLAALKTDSVMDRKIAYNLDARDPSNLTATVTLTYKNTNPAPTWRYTRYRSYTRVYVPEGSQLISSTGAMKDDLNKTRGVFIPGTVDVTKELGKTVFGTFWAIEPGKTGTLSFTYKLPPSVAANMSDGTYRLDWPKQAGSDSTQLTLHLNFGKNVVSASPPEDSTKWGDRRYDVESDTLVDRVFTVKLQ